MVKYNHRKDSEHRIEVMVQEKVFLSEWTHAKRTAGPLIYKLTLMRAMVNGKEVEG